MRKMWLRSTLLNRKISSKSAALSFDLLHKYKENVSIGKLRYDEKQFKVLNLFVKLKTHLESQTDNSNDVSQVEYLPKRLRGVYLHGQVGTGKTMLMDMFFNSLNIPANKKKRVHFHDFMLEVHQRIHNHKQFLLQTKGRNIHIDPKQCSITYVAQTIADEAQVLCFDEFQVTDICDAMILNKLFSLLWKSNTILITTSNRPPSYLYLNGLNRQYFLPFISALSAECIVRDMNSSVDYRQSMGGQRPFNVPNSDEMRDKIWREFLCDVQTLALSDGAVVNTATNTELETETDNMTESKICAPSVPGAVTIPVMMGRTLTVHHGYLPPVVDGDKRRRKGVAWMEFNALCCTDKGAADYSSLTTHFHTLYMHGVPRLSVLLHNEARRFITLVDEAYNGNVRLVWTAACPPSSLFEILLSSSTQRDRDEQSGATFGTDHSWSTGGSSGGSSDDESNSLRSLDYTTRDTDTKLLNLGDSAAAAADGIKQVFEIHSSKRLSDVVMSKYFSNSEQFMTNFSSSSSSSSPSASVDAAQDDFKVLEGELASIQDLSFAFQRAASRLTEMNSREYEDKWRELYGVK